MKAQVVIYFSQLRILVPEADNLLIYYSRKERLVYLRKARADEEYTAITEIDVPEKIIHSALEYLAIKDTLLPQLDDLLQEHTK